MIPCAIPCRFAAVPLYEGDGGRSRIDAPEARGGQYEPLRNSP